MNTSINVTAGDYPYVATALSYIFVDTYPAQQRLSEWFTWELNALLADPTEGLSESFHQLLAEYVNKANDLYADYLLQD